MQDLMSRELGGQGRRAAGRREEAEGARERSRGTAGARVQTKTVGTRSKLARRPPIVRVIHECHRRCTNEFMHHAPETVPVASPMHLLPQQYLRGPATLRNVLRSHL